MNTTATYSPMAHSDKKRQKKNHQSYMDKLFIPVQGCLLEVVREQYTDFYWDKERYSNIQSYGTFR